MILTRKEARSLFYSLLLIEVFLFLVYLALNQLGSPILMLDRFFEVGKLENVSFWCQLVMKLRVIFDLDGETNLPNWLSSMQLFGIGLINIFIARQTAPRELPSKTFFYLVGAVFIFLSADEVGALHERMTLVFSVVDWAPGFRGRQGIWIPLYAVAALLFLLVNFIHIIEFGRQCRQESFIIIAGIGVWLMGAVGLEIISYEYLYDNSLKYYYLVEVALEEFLEMAGVSMILFGSLLCADRKGGKQKDQASLEKKRNENDGLT